MSTLLRKFELLDLFHINWSRYFILTQQINFEFNILLATPKQKVTHSRKRLRMTSKGLKNLSNITKCHLCNEPKLLHTLCWACYKKFKQSLN